MAGAARAALAALLLTSAAACSSDAGAPPPAPSPSFTASALQLRDEEATATVHLRLYNTGEQTVDVASVRLGGPALDSPAARTEANGGNLIDPGALYTAPTEHGVPDCTAADEPGVLVATLADGHEVEVPLDAEGQRLVDWLVDGRCGLERLAEAVRIRFGPQWRAGTVDGGPAMIGTLALDRRGAGPAVEVVGVRGSVLLDLRMWPPRYSLAADDDSARLRVALMPAGRCDGHALSQSRQTFLLSVYARLAGQPEQRLVLPPSQPVQDRVLAMVRRSCGL